MAIQPIYFSAPFLLSKFLLYLFLHYFLWFVFTLLHFFVFTAIDDFIHVLLFQTPQWFFSDNIMHMIYWIEKANSCISIHSKYIKVDVADSQDSAHKERSISLLIVTKSRIMPEADFYMSQPLLSLGQVVTFKWTIHFN
jgi:hypothetical protein